MLKIKLDSRIETYRHIGQVSKCINVIIEELLRRAQEHDQSKLYLPEKDIFDEYTPKLKACTYGSEEYKGYLMEMKVALDHHYANNRHHPEYFAQGTFANYGSPVSCMSLVDVIEMLCDWKAATLRHDDGDIVESVEINCKRFGITGPMAHVLRNTVELFEERG